MAAVVNRRDDAQLASMRDLAETPAEIREARRFADGLARAAMDRGDFANALTYRTAADDLQRRYFAAREGER